MKTLFSRFPENTDRFFELVIQQEISFNPESILTLQDIITIRPGKITFCKTEVMYGIQQAGFPCPVISANTNNPFCKVKTPAPVILKPG